MLIQMVMRVVRLVAGLVAMDVIIVMLWVVLCLVCDTAFDLSFLNHPTGLSSYTGRDLTCLQQIGTLWLKTLLSLVHLFMLEALLHWPGGIT